MKNKHLRKGMFLLLAFLSFSAFAQNRKVTGKITDKPSGQGIPGASVIIKLGKIVFS